MKNRNAKKRNAGGFTLTEAIAIVAVMCCLVLVAVPSFAKSEGRGLTTACRNNLRLMMSAFHMYADENNSYFPGNHSDASTGTAWMGILEPSPGTNVLNPRNFLLAPYVPPRQNVLKCPADQAISRFAGREVARLRSISMNHAVGTKGSSGAQRLPVDGSWLLGDFGQHTANSQFYCYGKLSDIVAPAPAGLWVFMEEHPETINDGAFGNVGPIPPSAYRMIDYPGAWHDGAAMASFADGHVEEKKWVDSRTVPRAQFPAITAQPNNPDITWLANRTTAAVPK